MTAFALLFILSTLLAIIGISYPIVLKIFLGFMTTIGCFITFIALYTWYMDWRHPGWDEYNKTYEEFVNNHKKMRY